ncbi:MAG: toxin-antitoxin system TumE family protein [Betaproteobacteria bacterium]
MPALRLVKIVDETHLISRRRGNGKLRREIWVDGSGRVMRFNLAFINLDIHRGDNGRVLGYDSQHGVWHRHHLGETTPAGPATFDEIEARFEAEVQAYLKGRE